MNRLNTLLVKIAGVNYATTLSAIGLLTVLAGKLLLAYRTKDIAQILSSGQELTVDLGDAIRRTRAIEGQG